MIPVHPSHRHVSSCDSTNDLARSWAMDPADPAVHGSKVTADYQMQGRGRRGRSWQSAPGQNVLLSVILRPAMLQADAWQLGFLAALAVADALVDVGLEPRLKWPNDVLLDGKKVAGMLVETSSGGSLSSWTAIVGIGLNVNQDEFPDAERLLYPPTSLSLTTGRGWDVSALARRIAAALLRRAAQLEADGWEAVWPAWEQRVAHGAALKRGSTTATLVSVDSDGSARVRLPDGTFEVWTSVE